MSFGANLLSISYQVVFLLLLSSVTHKISNPPKDENGLTGRVFKIR